MIANKHVVATFFTYIFLIIAFRTIKPHGFAFLNPSVPILPHKLPVVKLNIHMNENLFAPAQFGQTPYSPRVSANQYGPIPAKLTAAITKGSLVTFSYNFFKPGHDPYPLVLITDASYPAIGPKAGMYMRGVNLHYLTFPDIKGLLQPNCNNINFSYSNIKGNEYIVSAFRQYKRRGIRQIRKLDCAFLLNVLASVRSLNPSEVEAIRNSVREQIRQLTNPVAAPSPEQPMG